MTKLIITIDTEEDNWGCYRSEGHTLKNIERLPALQDLFDSFGVRPTYLVTYPVACDDKAISILGGFCEDGRCEIGNHVHPWNTPPFEEETNAWNSMLCNLPADLQYKKIRCLHEAIQRNFGLTPVSFRAGRWAFGQETAKNLVRLGYKVDTSIAAFSDWSQYHGPDFSDVPPTPFKFSRDNYLKESSDWDMIEIPATVGYLQSDFARSNLIRKTITKRPFNYFKAAGILAKLGLLNKVWLSPEHSDGKTMIKLSKIMLGNNYSILNMMFHSSSLKAGLSPFVRTKDDERIFLNNIKEFLSFARNESIDAIRLSEVLQIDF